MPEDTPSVDVIDNSAIESVAAADNPIVTEIPAPKTRTTLSPKSALGMSDEPSEELRKITNDYKKSIGQEEEKPKTPPKPKQEKKPEAPKAPEKPKAEKPAEEKNPEPEKPKAPKKEEPNPLKAELDELKKELQALKAPKAPEPETPRTPTEQEIAAKDEEFLNSRISSYGKELLVSSEDMDTILDGGAPAAELFSKKMQAAARLSAKAELDARKYAHQNTQALMAELQRLEQRLAPLSERDVQVREYMEEQSFQSGFYEAHPQYAANKEFVQEVRSALRTNPKTADIFRSLTPEEQHKAIAAEIGRHAPRLGIKFAPPVVEQPKPVEPPKPKLPVTPPPPAVTPGAQTSTKPLDKQTAMARSLW